MVREFQYSFEITGLGTKDEWMYIARTCSTFSALKFYILQLKLYH